MAWADSKDSGAYGIASVPLDEKKKNRFAQIWYASLILVSYWLQITRLTPGSGLLFCCLHQNFLIKKKIVAKTITATTEPTEAEVISTENPVGL